VQMRSANSSSSSSKGDLSLALPVWAGALCVLYEPIGPDGGCCLTDRAFSPPQLAEEGARGPPWHLWGLFFGC
jgi:hypothetical protein